MLTQSIIDRAYAARDPLLTEHAVLQAKAGQLVRETPYMTPSAAYKGSSQSQLAEYRIVQGRLADIAHQLTQKYDPRVVTNMRYGRNARRSVFTRAKEAAASHVRFKLQEAAKQRTVNHAVQTLYGNPG